jgi:hypothetical protein
MNAPLLKTLKQTAAFALLISAFIVSSVPAARAEALFLFRSPDAAAPGHGATPRAIQQKTLLKLDEKGDLLIQCGCARFTVAYNAPADKFKPSEPQQYLQREHGTAFSGISLTASLSF